MDTSSRTARYLNRVAFAALLLAGLYPWTAGALAQQPADTSLPPPDYAIPPMNLDPDAQRKADQIRKEQYKSDTIGERGNLSLDIGKFVTEPDPIERSMPDVQEDSYTGMRLRLPLRGGRE